MDLMPPGSTVVDAGANIGTFTIFFAHAVGPYGAVYAFEPQRKLHQVCVHAWDRIVFRFVRVVWDRGPQAA